MSGFFVWVFSKLAVHFYKCWNTGKLPGYGRGSKLRKGHRDNIISWEVKIHISFENNRKLFSHYNLKNKNSQGQKRNKTDINQEKYSTTKSVIQQCRSYLQKERILSQEKVTEKDALNKVKDINPCLDH